LFMCIVRLRQGGEDVALDANVVSSLRDLVPTFRVTQH
jgi:hypothetical protein